MRTKITAAEKRYIDRARVCHIGSQDVSGWTHVAPLSHAYDAARRTLYVATDGGGRTATNLRARPRASLACDDYSETWGRLHGVVLRSRARSIRRGAELERATKLLRKKFKQYRTIEIDYVIALRIEAVVASWGL